MANRQVVTARIIIESSSESTERTSGYVISALKNACKNIRDGTVLITIYDDKDHIVGVDMSGTPSADLEDIFEDMIDKIGEGGPIKVTPRPPSAR